MTPEKFSGSVLVLAKNSDLPFAFPAIKNSTDDNDDVDDNEHHNTYRQPSSEVI
jgi:hypothetical protein